MFDAVFVSDIHLSTDVPARTAVFVSFLRRLHTRKLYILGDLFDFWVGGDHARLFHGSGLFDALTQLRADGTEIFILPGNRDFLISNTAPHIFPAEILPETHTINSPYGRTLLLHGDQLLLNDVGYTLFRFCSRQKVLRLLYLSLPLQLRLGIARIMRQQSKTAVKRKRNKNPRILQFSRYALSSLLRQGFRCVVCGHIHRTSKFCFRVGNDTLHIYVLGQWTQNGGDFLTLNSGRFVFHTFKA
ncbi:MAG: UDP-2,3-diacylglucosamine diphosphatase [Planctomycetota bacterium]|nr:MAG: UDP-2,3-diacylglucosamine diphosphatase [Planctomycetota bacterium]